MHHLVHGSVQTQSIKYLSIWLMLTVLIVWLTVKVHCIFSVFFSVRLSKSLILFSSTSFFLHISFCPAHVFTLLFAFCSPFKTHCQVFLIDSKCSHVQIMQNICIFSVHILEAICCMVSYPVAYYCQILKIRKIQKIPRSIEIEIVPIDLSLHLFIRPRNFIIYNFSSVRQSSLSRLIAQCPYI